jgi:SAM-dependent methyltransferase
VTEVFGADYADSYDALYADKDYGAECDLLEEIFLGADRRVRSVLDLGCGTGRHSVELARRGYQVVGVDLSEGMLDRARRRAISEGVSGSTTFVLGDIQKIHVGRRFDAVLSMFAVVGYQIGDSAVRATLANVRRHLERGGTFVFDVWYGPAVLVVGPSTRVKVVPTADGEIERRAVGALDPESHVCTITYELTRRRVGQPDATASETHRMRYFFEEELGGFLKEAGLTLRSVSSFPDVDSPPSVDSWNVLVVAEG